MKTSKMVLLDYGQTLIAEQKFDGVKGTEATLQSIRRMYPSKLVTSTLLYIQ